MEVRCKVCGTLQSITKAHKDFQRIAKQPETTFICEKCSIRIQVEMQNKQDFRKTR